MPIIPFHTRGIKSRAPPARGHGPGGPAALPEARPVMASQTRPVAPGPGARHWLPAALAAAGFLVVAALAGGPAAASPTEVVKAVFARAGESWRVSVTLRHADSGWEHYARLWVVETLDGRELGRRVLLHPHVNEQPFTRSQTMTLPAGIRTVRVRAGDNVNGLNSNIVVVELTRPSGERYEVR